MRPTMRLASALVLTAFLAPLGCGGGKAGGEARGAGEKGSAAKTPAHKITPLPWRSEEAPVAVEFAGLSADKKSARYRIHLVSDKPVAQVDIGYVYTGADGSQQRGTVVWQNPAGPKSLPTDKGKDHEDQIPVERGTTSVTFTVLHVVFKDKTSWAR